MVEIAADQERAMYASREVEKRQRVVATELMQLEQQRRQVQSELRGLQKQQRIVEDEFGEIERQQRAIEAKLLEMQLRQKQVEYETQLKELIYEANTPVGMGYVRHLPRQRSVPRHVGRSTTPDTLRSYDSSQYVLERPQSAQMERRYLPGGSLQREGMCAPSSRKLKRSSSLKKLFSSLGRSKDKQRDQYGDVEAQPKKSSGALRSMKKKLNSVTASFYEAQKPYETVSFKRNKDGGATAYTDSQPGTPTGLPPSSGKKSLHGKDNTKQGGINIVRSNQQVNAANPPLKITEKKSYMVEESTDYIRKTYLPREEFAITSSKAEFNESGARPESLISVKEDTITPRLVKQTSREEAIKEAMGTLEKQEQEKKTLKEAEATQKVEGQKDSGGVKVVVTEPEVDPKVKKETAAKEAKLMKMAAGAETPKQQSMDKMESLEKMTNDNGHVEEKYKTLEEQTQEAAGKEDEFGKWKVKRMDKADTDMPSSTEKDRGQSGDLEMKKDEGQSGKLGEKPKESKIAAAVNQGKTKIEEMATDTKSAVQSARFRPTVTVGARKNEAPAPPATSSGQMSPGVQPAANQQQQQPMANQQQPAGKTVSQPAVAVGSRPAVQLPADYQQQQPAAPSIEQVRLTNYDNIDFSDYYRNLETSTTGVVDRVERAHVTCSAHSDSTCDSGVSSLERPPSLRQPHTRTKPPISTAGAKLIIDGNRNNTREVNHEGQYKPRSRSAETVQIKKQNQNNGKRSKSAEGQSSMRVSQRMTETVHTETVVETDAENGSQKDIPHTPPNSPESTPTETPKSTPRHTPKMLRRYFQPLRSSSPKNSPKTTPKTTPKSTPEGSPDDSPGGSPSSTPKGSRRGTPKALRRILQPVVENVVHAVKTSWDKHRPRSRSGSRSRGGTSSCDKSPDQYIETSATSDVSSASYVTSYVTTISGTSTTSSTITDDVIAPTHDVTGSNQSPNTITIDDTVVVLRRDISRRRTEAARREQRSSRSMDRATQETRVPEEMQVKPVRRSLSCDLSELDNLDLPYVSMTNVEEKKRKQQDASSLNYNNEYDALIKRMNLLAEVAEQDLKAQARAQPQRIMYYDTGPYKS